MARGVVVIDKENIVKYVEIVEVASNEPNYEAGFTDIKKTIKTQTQKLILGFYLTTSP
ncbi:MAG: hypothetical protein MZV63_41775 [Marinilabiliales bacterium]|nr:hypothetical protein [Marinilabiliales bacterium]